MNAPEPIPFKADWPEPAPRFVREELLPAPALPLRDVLGPRLSQWVADAAQAKGAPPDYVFAAVLSVAGASRCAASASRRSIRMMSSRC